MKLRKAIVVSLLMTFTFGACSSGQIQSIQSDGGSSKPWNPYNIIDPQTVSFSSLNNSNLNLSTANSCEEISVRLRREKMQQLLRAYENEDSYCNPVIMLMDDTVDSSGGVSFTEQNSQVENVLESEQVMTNGTIVAQAKNDSIVITKVWPLDKVEVSSSIDLPENFSSVYFSGLILKEDTLVAFYRGYGQGSFKSGWLTYDVSNPRSPLLLQNIQWNTNSLKVRLTGSDLTTVGSVDMSPEISYHSSEFNDVEACEVVNGESRFTEEFREVLASHFEEQYQSLRQWSVEESLPVLEGDSSKTIACDQIAQNDYTSGGKVTLITKGDVTADVDDLQTQTIAGAAMTTYVNHQSIILLETIDSNQFEVENENGDFISASMMHVVQHVNALTYKGSALVTGNTIQDRPFQIDERKGMIRITTDVRDTSLRSVSAPIDVHFSIYRVSENGVNLISRIDNIIASEEVFAARYDSERAYIVTYDVVRASDPLFVIDTTNPENPQILGDLVMPGFSSYLHQMDDDSLLGIGATDASCIWTYCSSSDYKIALFKVDSNGMPYEEEQITFEVGYSDTYYNHLSFHYEEELETLYFPYMNYEGRDFENRVKVMTLNSNDLSETTDIALSENLGYVLKSFRIHGSGDDVLVFAGEEGLQILDRATLAELDQITY